MEVAGAFRIALQAIKAMHDDRWLHRDLKPTNIRMVGHPSRGVLLDLGSARHLQPGTNLKPTPGHSGIVNYLAPEREIQKHDHSIDIWAMGAIGYELTYGIHPWKLELNPWRDDKPECEKLRPLFRQKYQDAIHKLYTDYRDSSESPLYLHRG